MKKDVEKILVTEEELAKKVAELGGQITADFKGKELVLLTVLKGSMVFAADLMRKIESPMVLDFISASSYGSGSETSGTVTIKQDVRECLEGKNVLIVEDVIDSGVTLSFLKDYILKKGAAEVKICTMLDKPSRRKKNISADYVGFEIPDEFVIGYGLDYDERYRSLPYIGILKRSVYEK